MHSFIAKYAEGLQTNLESHYDDTSLTASILLSDPERFIGGELEYEDGKKCIFDRGDMMIHSKQHHHFINISYGERYVLVFFCDASE